MSQRREDPSCVSCPYRHIRFPALLSSPGFADDYVFRVNLILWGSKSAKSVKTTALPLKQQCSANATSLKEKSFSIDLPWAIPGSSPFGPTWGADGAALGSVARWPHGVDWLLTEQTWVRCFYCEKKMCAKCFPNEIIYVTKSLDVNFYNLIINRLSTIWIYLYSTTGLLYKSPSSSQPTETTQMSRVHLMRQRTSIN